MLNRLLVASVILVAAACGGEPTAPPVATRLVLSVSTLSFDAVGQSETVTATVFDQRGAVMPDAPVTFAVSEGTAAVTPTAAAAGAPRSAIIRSLATGVARITATSGGATASLTLTVDQLAVSLTSGRLSARVNEVLFQLPVLLSDRLGAPVAGRVVTFAVASGGGSVSVSSATTDAEGTARTDWRLGTTTATPQELAVTSGTLTARVTAEATAGPPASVRVVAGADQSGPLNTALTVSPSVRVADSFDNPVLTATVSFTVTGGGGSVIAPLSTTRSGGIATVGAFVLGPLPGANTLTATVAGVPSLSVPIQATGTPTGTRGSVSISAGNSQAGIAGAPVFARPAVLVRDGAGLPARGVPITFIVRSGGGTVTGPTVESDSNGVAAVGAWTLGDVATPNTLSIATSGDLAGTALVLFTAIGCTSNAAMGFSISVCFTTQVTASQRDAFTQAAARWATVITGDVPDFAPTLASVCGSGITINQGVDDLTVLASLQDIDGPGGVLGNAGPCIIRSGSFPLVGIMRFDIADVATLESRSQFGAVILHEMGHVLGIGALWQTFGLLRLPSTATDTLDTHFVGERAIAAFDQIGGSTYTAGLKVPVENRGGPGTRNGHWREAVLRAELMTGFLSADVPNPLSVLSIASLIDLGYVASLEAADPFTFTASLQANASRSGTDGIGIHLGNDLYAGPVHSVGRDGRMVRIK